MLYQLIYEKLLVHQADSGKILNFISADAQVFIDTLSCLDLAILSPFSIIAILVVLYTKISYYCFIALGVCIAVVPINAYETCLSIPCTYAALYIFINIFLNCLKEHLSANNIF